MPVVILGASGPLGRALVPRLVAAGSEVRAVVSRSEDVEPLRAVGAKVAAGDPSDPELLAAVLRDAHTLCHLVDGLFLSEEEHEAAIAGSARAAVDTAGEAGLSRILLLSYPGADAGSGNAFLRAKGMAEEAVRGSGLEHAVIRSALVVAEGEMWPRFLAPGAHRVAPVYVEDLAEVLAAADDRAQPVSGTFGLQGPDTVTADEFAALVAPNARGTIGSGELTVSRMAKEVLTTDSLSDEADAAAEFGVKLTPLREALRASGFQAD